MTETPPPEELARPALAGIKAAIGVPALGLFVGLMGYGALNRGLGVEFEVMMGAVFLIWSMPAMMTFSELSVSEVGIWAMFAAVLFANLRNIPMVVTSLPLIREKRGLRWHDLFFAQLLAPTIWVLVLVQAQRIPLAARRRYFTAMAVAVFVCALVGATVGYFGVGSLPASVAVSLLMLTPLYLLLIMVSVRKLSGYLALGLGALTVPWLMQWSVEWGLALGGIAAGTLGFILGQWNDKRRPE